MGNGGAKDANVDKQASPFWGLISELVRREGTPNEKRARLVRVGKSDLFGTFYPVGRRSLTFLNNRTVEELALAGEEMLKAIELEQQFYVETATDIYVKRLIERGGWELNYLPPDSLRTEGNIRRLIENWSSEWDQLWELPKPEDISKLEALEACIEGNGNDLILFGLAEPSKYELYALLALLVVCDAIHENPLEVEFGVAMSGIKSWQVMAIGRASIEALEVFNLAERERTEQKLKGTTAKQQAEFFEEELQRRTSERGKNAANKRHAASREARKWVVQEWVQHGVKEYGGNKSEFSRVYMGLVKQKFSDANGDPLSVTDKTIREQWLKTGSPDAGIAA